MSADATPSVGARRALVFATAVGIAWLASRSEGYRLADSVEYMDRAWDIARGEGLGPESPRSFCFSALLLPFFAVGELLGLRDLSGVVVAIRLAQAAAALACVAVVVRTTSRLVEGRAGGLIAGAFVGLNPVFLSFASEPVSGIAATLLVALGFEALFAPRDAERARTLRGGLAVGLYLGSAFLVAYRTLPIVLLLLGVGLLRDRLRVRGPWGGIALGLALATLVGCLLDQLVFGSFGITMRRYLAANIGGVATSLAAKLGFVDLAKAIYAELAAAAAAGESFQAADADTIRSLTPATWYLTELSARFVAIPGLVLFALGALRALARPRAAHLAALLTTVVVVGLLSMKGAKSFRLWMPLLPLLAPLLALGATTLAGGAPASTRLAGARRAVAVLCVVATLALGLAIASEQNLRRFGGFWRATERIADAVDVDARDDDPLRFGASYHWAVLFRQRAGLELVKLPHHLDAWSALDEPRRDELVGALEEYDVFVTHLQALTVAPRLAEVVARRFAVAAVEWEPEAAGELGPVFLLVRPELAREPELARPFVTRRAVSGDDELAELRRAVDHPSGLSLFEEGLDLEYLGFDLETGLAGGEGAWLTHHVLVHENQRDDRRLRERLSDNLGRPIRIEDRRFHGGAPLSTWEAGTVVSESVFVVVPRDVRRFGGPYGRGELVPLELYLAITDENGEVTAAPWPPTDPPAEPYAGRESWRLLGSRGVRRHPAGDVLAGGAWLPVPSRRELPPPGEAP